MALIKCNDCGKEFSDKAIACPNCGCPTAEPKEVKSVVAVNVVKEKGFWSTGRLAIGIISIILFFIVSFQSCAAGLSNALQDNGATSGTSGFFLSLMLLIAGIVGICTRNSSIKVGPIISTVMYWLGALLTIGTGDTYGDLPIWGFISFMFGLVFLISAIKTKKITK